MARFFAGTRKGLFEWTLSPTGRWEIVRVSFLGDPVSMVLHDPRDNSIYAGLALGHFGTKLRRSTDGGATWTECNVPVYPTVEPPPEKPLKLEYIWALETRYRDRPGTLWCGTVPGGLFSSDDAGQTWQLNEPLWTRPEKSKWFGGGMNQPGIHSICVDPRNDDHVTVGVSCGGVCQTTDGGLTWATRADGMWAAYMPPEMKGDPDIQDPHRVVQAPSQPDVFWSQHHNGMFRSDDNCTTWRDVGEGLPATFGFAVAVHPQDGKTAWFVPGIKDECRVPLEGRLSVTRTRDGGKTYEHLRNGLPQHHAYDLVYRHCLDIDATGTHLAMGSTTGGLWTSHDQGEHWHLAPERLPPVLCLRFSREKTF